MRSSAVLVLLFIAGTLGAPRESRLLQANVDKYIDVLLAQVDKWVINQGMDPLDLEDIIKTFPVPLPTVHGELRLTNGHMQGLSEVGRGGNSEMRYEAMYLNLKLPLLIEHANVDFDYNIKVLDLHHSGAMEGRIKNLLIFLDVNIDTKTFEVILQDFHIIDAGAIDVKFGGHPMLDWLANIVSKLVTSILHDVVKNVVEVQIKEVLEEAVQKFNDNRPPHVEMLIAKQQDLNDFVLNYLAREITL